MKVLVTGARGTVGRALVAALAARGDEGVAWDRREVALDDYWAMERYVRQSGAGALVHLAIAATPTGRANEGWLVNYEWSSELAWICRQLALPFLFTSTAMVFSNAAHGPFAAGSVPDADEGYGYQKRRAEERVRSQYPETVIARLGWQLAPLGQDAGDNTMQRSLERQAAHGAVRASTRWLPACSFVDDTAAALAALVRGAPGLYQLDSNRGWSFHEIVSALAAAEGRPWRIEASEDFVYDQRLLDERVALPALRTRLPGLPALGSV